MMLQETLQSPCGYRELLAKLLSKALFAPSIENRRRHRDS